MAKKKLCRIVGEHRFEAGVQCQELRNQRIRNLAILTKG